MLFSLYYTNVDLYVYSPVIVLINKLINSSFLYHTQTSISPYDQLVSMLIYLIAELLG